MAENNLVKTNVSENSIQPFSTKENFEQAWRMAKCLSSSTIVPKAYQGEDNVGNCMIALEMASRINMSPIMTMQNLYVVYGNTGWSSKFLIACVNTCGKFKTPLRYEYKGKENTDEWSCRAYAVDNADEKLYGSWVSIGMAKKEGWYTKSGSKWQTMPELMMQYRAGAFFQRAYVPEISMGMVSAEELQDTKGKIIDLEPSDYSELKEEFKEAAEVADDKKENPKQNAKKEEQKEQPKDEEF
jgi:hypothetical protein